VFLAALCFVATEAWVLTNWSTASYVVAPTEPIIALLLAAVFLSVLKAQNENMSASQYSSASSLH
jgi:hypothetical protein